MAMMMMQAKKIVLQSGSCEHRKESLHGIVDDGTYDAVVVELITASISVFTWQSSYALSAYIATHAEMFRGKVVLELGAGTALPSIIAAKVGAAKVIVTDRVNEPELRQVAEVNIRVNEVGYCCSYVDLDWASCCSDGDGGDERGGGLFGINIGAPIDVILGSDVLYSSENFDEILALVATVFVSNPSAVFVTMYKERSSKRSLIPYLDMYGMTVVHIPLHSFLNKAQIPQQQNPYHFYQATMEFQTTLTVDETHACINSSSNSSSSSSSSSCCCCCCCSCSSCGSTDENNVDLMQFDGVFCLLIKLKGSS